MPPDEGLALYAAGVDASAPGARSAVARDRQLLRQVGHLPGCRGRRRQTWCCSPSTTIAAPRRTRPAGSGTSPTSSIPTVGRMDTLPLFRRTIYDAGLEGHVGRHGGRCADARPLLDDAAGAAVHRRRPRRRAGAPRLRAVDAVRGARRAAGHPRRVPRPRRRRPARRSRSTGGRWRRATSPRSAACGSLRVLERLDNGARPRARARASTL